MPSWHGTWLSTGTYWTFHLLDSKCVSSHETFFFSVSIFNHVALIVARWHLGLSFQGKDSNLEVPWEQAAEANRMENTRKCMAVELDQDGGRILVCVLYGCDVSVCSWLGVGSSERYKLFTLWFSYSRHLIIVLYRWVQLKRYNFLWAKSRISAWRRRNPGSVVGIAPTLWAGRSTVLTPVGAWEFLFSVPVQTCPEVLFRRVKVAGAWRWPPTPI